MYNVVVFRQRDGGGYVAVFYRSGLPIDDVRRRRDEAFEVAAVYGAFADSYGLSRISARVCSTRDAVELREAPEAIFGLYRGIDGTWTHDAPSS